jgi:hypothetical protein
MNGTQKTQKFFFLSFGQICVVAKVANGLHKDFTKFG